MFCYFIVCLLSFRCNEICYFDSEDYCCSLVPADEAFFNASTTLNLIFSLDWNVKHFISKRPPEIYSSNSWLVYYHLQSSSDFSVVENIKTNFKNIVSIFKTMYYMLLKKNYLTITVQQSSPGLVCKGVCFSFSKFGTFYDWWIEFH